MADFHFLRPEWLLALPLGVVLIFLLAKVHSGGGGWRRFVDPALQPFVLTTPAMLAGRRWPLAVALVAWLIATLALAGPTWQRLPVPAFRSSDALVVALDLSRSMDAADLAPSRLARAKLKLLSLLEHRSGGQIGLVVFTAHAFAVTPLTTDTRTIAALVGALSTDIMPSRGSRIEAGLDKAAALLRQTGVPGGEVLLITDAQPSGEALQRVRDLAAEGIVVHALGVGTTEGAPIPEPDGGFLTDGSGRVVVPSFDPGSLRRLVAAGGGRFAVLTADDRDLDALAATPAADPLGPTTEDDPREADVWRDAGTWLAVALVPLVALGFRRGWVVVLLVLVSLPTAPLRAQPPEFGSREAAGQDAAATETGFSLAELWQGLWQRPDQRGAEAFAAEQPQRAARLFEDPAWRAAAQYRAGAFADSAGSLSGVDTADAHYNRGNALARAGQLDGAIAAYDRALELLPEHADARFNRDLLEELRQQQEQEQQQQQQSSDQADSQTQESQQSDQEAGEGSDASQGEASSDDQAGEQQARDADSADSPPSDGQSASDDATDAEDDGNEDAAEDDGESDPGEADERLASASGQPTPQELEQWESEQAAEQWLRRIPQDPGGLLRRKFLYQYQRLGIDQDGNYVWPGDEAEPW